MHHALQCLRAVTDSIFLPRSLAWIGLDLRRLLLEIGDQIVRRTRTKSAAPRVLPNVITNVGRIQQEMLTDGRLIYLRELGRDRREQGASLYRHSRRRELRRARQTWRAI